jgi:uncharacterized repeat protein (TIGR03803 family)
MRQKKFWFTVSGIMAVLAMALMLPTRAAAANKFKVLYRFEVPPDAGLPRSGVIFDAAGNLYGAAGGYIFPGDVFKLKRNSDGSWTERVLYRFKEPDGRYPWGALIFDPAGNLYGTTVLAGNYQSCSDGCGTVFELIHSSSGAWTHVALHNFTRADGAQPSAGLVFDTSGNLYGTTSAGGAHYSGVAFKLTPNSDGTWTESVLHSFCSLKNCADGDGPSAPLIFDSAGNLYGTANSGGTGGSGVVFKLMPNADGTWTEQVLHTFCSLKNCADGAQPFAGLTFDTAGNLYGTTAGGGAHHSGVAFKLTPNSDGTWTETLLHTFANSTGANPFAGLSFDAAGNLYGTTGHGGNPVDGGTVFKLTHNSNGRWSYSLLHVFLGNPAFGPFGGVLLDKAGNLYGTTTECGNGETCLGTVFEVTP